METMIAKLRWLGVVALSLLGCNDLPQGPSDPPVFQVTPVDQWSGGSVTVRSGFFRNRTTLPVFSADTHTVAAVRLDDSTLVLTLPSIASGTVSLTASVNGNTYDLDDVTVVGFSDRRDISLSLNGVLLERRAPQGPVVLGNTSAGNIAMISPVTGIVTNFPTLFPPGAPYNIAPSYQGSDVFVLRDTSTVVGEWRLWPAPVILDTVATGFKFQFTRHVVTFAPDIYMITGSHMSTTYSPTGTRFFTTESVWANFVSPVSERAVVGSKVGQPGIQVIDMTTGDTAFTLPVRTSVGAAFSSDGSFLYASGGEFNTNQLMKVDAAAGTVLVLDSVPADTYKYSIALSGSGNRLYVAGELDGRPRVLVYDAATLGLLANLAVPNTDSFDCVLTCWEGVISLDEVFGKVYYTVPSDLHGFPTRVYGFDIIPE